MTPTEHPILGKLAQALDGTLPPALQLAADDEPVPLAIGSGDELETLLTARGLPAADAAKLVRGTLRHLTRTRRYLEEVANETSWRHSLDGERAERVSPEHTLAASNILLARAIQQQTKATKSAPQAKPKADPQPPKPAPVRQVAQVSPAVLPAARRPGVTVRRRP